MRESSPSYCHQCGSNVAPNAFGDSGPNPSATEESQEISDLTTPFNCVICGVALLAIDKDTTGRVLPCGNGHANFELALLRLLGSGVPQDTDKAVRLFTLARPTSPEYGDEFLAEFSSHFKDE